MRHGSARRNGLRRRYVILLGVASLVGGFALGRVAIARPLRPVARPSVPAAQPREQTPPSPAAPAAPPAPSPFAVAPLADTIPPPAEFAPQQALIFVCGPILAGAPNVFAEIVEALHDRITLVGIVSCEDEERMARAMLEQHRLPPHAVRFLTMPLDSMWIRDYGPLVVRRADGTFVLADFDYVIADSDIQRPLDDALPAALSQWLRLPLAHVPLRLEGGNLLTNGAGLAVTTTAVLDRNADTLPDANAIAALFAEYAGFDQWVALPTLSGESTGHVDVFVTLVAPDLAVVARYDPAQDPINAQILDDAADALARVQTPCGPMRIRRIDTPAPTGGLFYSYTNVVFANGVLLVPVYSEVDPIQQQRALDLYSELLPDWKILPIRADLLAVQDGQLHCITLSLPAGVPLPAPTPPPPPAAEPGPAGANAWGEAAPGSDGPAPQGSGSGAAE